jgi:hypothetical protein
MRSRFSQFLHPPDIFLFSGILRLVVISTSDRSAPLTSLSPKTHARQALPPTPCGTSQFKKTGLLKSTTTELLESYQDKPSSTCYFGKPSNPCWSVTLESLQTQSVRMTMIQKGCSRSPRHWYRPRHFYSRRA